MAVPADATARISFKLTTFFKIPMRNTLISIGEDAGFGLPGADYLG